MRIKIDSNLNCDFNLKLSDTKSIKVKSLQKDLVIEMDEVEFSNILKKIHPLIQVSKLPEENFTYTFKVESLDSKEVLVDEKVINEFRELPGEIFFKVK